jgi:uncharacterized alkaline shock family protein YloU
LETIATLATEQVEGVASVPGKGVAGLVQKGSTRPINICVGDDGALSAQVRISVHFGTPLRSVAYAVQESVADALLSQTGHAVSSVDVFIDSITFPEQ